LADETSAGAAASTAIYFDVDEWSIEYSSPPLLWLRSKRAWCVRRNPMFLQFDHQANLAAHSTNSATAVAVALFIRYKLLQPKPTYKHFFSTIQRKFEVCTGIVNLMGASKMVSYDQVVAHVRYARRLFPCEASQ
jgi:hypothetical protein